ncbi:pyridoxamine 5'-phosphate oxidase family protein [Streptomyces lichenis]|uniref:Pyridoxamine 5'-phosphate oxidase family protein n=2 Tax=Streptomyces lichenis TaxID=2306967 RepID=A0ABT0IC54_9ACTN|nr:pyridoxamine 5'-phosphate oxidase family protein [Streptomyces lichenis]MCK8678908.1 pyridoxamine 5'-phosphate oxidase family protein [Streptomyces lichenis]
MVPLGRDEALRLLGGVSLGRVVFTEHALPAVRPVNHLVDGADVVIRVHDGATLASLGAPDGTPGAVVAYEADLIDPVSHLGWSVVVTGYAHLVREQAALERYAARLRPWVDRPMTAALRIRPDLVTGFRLEAARAAPRTGTAAGLVPGAPPGRAPGAA